MAISIANVALSDTFDIWRVRTNQALYGLNRATPDATANTVVFRDDNGNTAVVSLESEDITSNTSSFNHLIVANTIDFDGAEISNTGVIQYTDIRSGVLSNVVISGTSSDIDIPTGEFDELRVTSDLNFSGATISDLGTVENMIINGGTLQGIQINRDYGGTFSTANFRSLTVEKVDASTGVVDFRTANVLHLGYVSAGTIAGGVIENVDLNFANTSGSFTINVQATFQNNAFLRATSGTTGSKPYFYVKTTGATTGSTLTLIDEGISTDPRSVLRVSQNNSSATSATALSVHAKAGKPLVVANNSSDIITVYQNGSVFFAGNTSTLDSENLIINDPLILINKQGTSADSGLLIKKDTTNSYAVFWDKSKTQFALGETSSDATTSGDIIVDDTKYLDLKLKKLTLTGNVTSTSGTTIFEDTTTASNTSTGSVVVEGGMGVASKLYVGDDVVISHGGILEVNDDDDASNTTTGAVQIAGGVGIAKKLYVGDDVVISHGGILEVNDETDTFNTTTGAVQIAGGVGIAKNLYVGGNTTVVGTLTVTNVADTAGALTVSDDTDASNTTTGALQVTGGVGIAKKLYVGSTITEVSSLTLKENVETFSNPLNVIENLRGVTYEWIDKRVEGKQIGLIAEEVQKVLPEVSDGNGVAYTKLIGVLVEGIKELSNKVKDLESKIKG